MDQMGQGLVHLGFREMNALTMAWQNPLEVIIEEFGEGLFLLSP